MTWSPSLKMGRLLQLMNEQGITHVCDHTTNSMILLIRFSILSDT